MRIDLHCHTYVSPDSVTPVEDFPRRCCEEQIDVQAITDHSKVRGALELQAYVREVQDDDLTVIVGEEILTSEGELIGLFLAEHIESGLSPEETVRRIKAQGGLVLLPHGFDPLKPSRLEPEARERIAASIDIVETHNGHVSLPRWNRLAARWAEKHGKSKSAGSDAHTPDAIGRAWVETPGRPVHGPQDLLDALQAGSPTGAWTHPLLDILGLVWAAMRKFFKFLRNRLWPGRRR